jgi:hypothetical protein
MSSNAAKKLEITRVDWDDNGAEEARLRQLVAERKTDDEIAEILNKEFGGLRAASSVTNKRHALQLLKGKPRNKGGTTARQPQNLRNEVEAMLTKPKVAHVNPAMDKSQLQDSGDGIKISYPRAIISLAGMPFDAIVALTAELKGKGFFCTVELQKEA